jgi:peptidoglycan/xylan/chitin deacetylase (PgdA/CDA1 family)
MSLTIIMYHYVRDPLRSRYPGIKGRSLKEFRAQLDYIASRYTVVTAQEAVAAIRREASVPENAAWLTFDDGYLDHYSNVFPLLFERGWQGSFFPPSQTVLEGKLLDVNKIHFILAAQGDTDVIIHEIRASVEKGSECQGVRSFQEYWDELAKPSRYDPAEVVFIKRSLQFGLPSLLRTETVDRLFRRFVSVDPAAFAAELYISQDQLRAMIRCGMYVGSHGASHRWLDRLVPIEQAFEIDASLDFLRSMGAPTQDWVMCYPYGAFDQSVLQLLKQRNCGAALTISPGIASLEADDPLLLPRIDTNDLPTKAL